MFAQMPPISFTPARLFHFHAILSRNQTALPELTVQRNGKRRWHGRGSSDTWQGRIEPK